MRQPPRPVTVSIVSHGQWDLVRPLIEQLCRWCSASIQRIVLTVNQPETVDLDPGLPIPVHVIRNARSQGFGANHNRAFDSCDTPWFLVLNPDIRLNGDVLSPMLQSAQPKAGVVAPRIREPGRSEPEPYRWLLTPAELLRRRSPGHRPPPRPAWVAGMFMLLRSEAFLQVKGFDERYFMYCEDFDLCARLRLQGWHIQVADQVCVRHEAQRASNKSLGPLLWHVRSFVRVWMSDTFWRYRLLLQLGDEHS